MALYSTVIATYKASFPLSHPKWLIVLNFVINVVFILHICLKLFFLRYKDGKAMFINQDSRAIFVRRLLSLSCHFELVFVIFHFIPLPEFNEHHPRLSIIVIARLLRLKRVIVFLSRWSEVHKVLFYVNTDGHELQYQKMMDAIPRSLRPNVMQELYGWLVQNINLFRGISEDAMVKLVSELIIECDHATGVEVVAKDERPTTHFYILVGGKMEVLFQDGDAPLIPTHIAPAGLCGEIGVLCCCEHHLSPFGPQN
ncbi:hypothetical protein OROGR_005389 [Orobanche gracilis]